MEGQPVVKAALGKLNEISDGNRRSISVKRYGYFSVVADSYNCGAILGTAAVLAACTEQRHRAYKRREKRDISDKLISFHFIIPRRGHRPLPYERGFPFLLSCIKYGLRRSFMPHTECVAQSAAFRRSCSVFRVPYKTRLAQTAARLLDCFFALAGW